MHVFSVSDATFAKKHILQYTAVARSTIVKVAATSNSYHLEEKKLSSFSSVARDNDSCLSQCIALDCIGLILGWKPLFFCILLSHQGVLMDFLLLVSTLFVVTNSLDH